MKYIKYITLITTMHVITFCWLCGIELGIAKTNHEQRLRDAPYRAIMHEAATNLQDWGYRVREPDELPPVLLCNSCLADHEAFGAYVQNPDSIYLPEHTDIATLDGHAALVHEYGHYLLTKAGVPAEEQEKLCLALGNVSFQKFFTAAAN